MWCDLRLPRASCVQTERPRAEVRNQQSAAEHGDILHKHSHLDLRRHRIGYGPELKHHQRDWNQKQNDEPCSKFCAIAQQILSPPRIASTPERGTAIEAKGTPCEAA
jgi:hypothetical protein